MGYNWKKIKVETLKQMDQRLKKELPLKKNSNSNENNEMNERVINIIGNCDQFIN